VKSVTVRELRNDGGAVLDRVARGEELVVTRNGVEVAELRPRRRRAPAPTEFVVGPLLDNPHRVGKQLQPPLADRYIARRGTYRVIYRIDDQQETVTVLTIPHRSDAYHR
jgi:prevent-host-death family protein